MAHRWLVHPPPTRVSPSRLGVRLRSGADPRWTALEDSDRRRRVLAGMPGAGRRTAVACDRGARDVGRPVHPVWCPRSRPVRQRPGVHGGAHPALAQTLGRPDAFWFLTRMYARFGAMAGPPCSDRGCGCNSLLSGSHRLYGSSQGSVQLWPVPWLISQALSSTYVAGEHRLYLERNCRLSESPAHCTRRKSRGACQVQGAEQSARVRPSGKTSAKSRPRSTSVPGSLPCKCQRFSTLRWDRLPSSRPPPRAGPAQAAVD